MDAWRAQSLSMDIRVLHGGWELLTPQDGRLETWATAEKVKAPTATIMEDFILIDWERRLEVCLRSCFARSG